MDEMLAHVPMAGAVLLGVVFFLVFFRPSITRLLDGVKKVGPIEIDAAALQADQQASAVKAPSAGGGILASSPSTMSGSGADAPAITGAIVPAVAPADVARANVLRNVGVSPVVIEQESAIRRDLAKLPESEWTDLLIRHMAITQLHLLAEQTYRLIFGSQLKMLEHLNHYGSTPTKQLVESFYEPAALQFPKVYEKMTKEEYFGYPLHNNLIECTPDGGTFSITARGKAFLQWIVTQGILASKPF